MLISEPSTLILLIGGAVSFCHQLR
ncbi:PEP-CTERM sorting domain-containing protein [Moraxella osloensis]|nr:PEP-CTERM sorting domain-containing protein [Moraxella osloensis]